MVRVRLGVGLGASLLLIAGCRCTIHDIIIIIIIIKYIVAAYAGPSRRQPRLRLQLVARQVRRLDPWNAGPTDRR